MLNVKFVGQFINTGASTSRTVMLMEHVEVFPAASIAVQTTVVVPIGKVAPAKLYGFDHCV